MGPANTYAKSLSLSLRHVYPISCQQAMVSCKPTMNQETQNSAGDTSYGARNYILLGLPVLLFLSYFFANGRIEEKLFVFWSRNQLSQGCYRAHIILHIEVLSLNKKYSWLLNFKMIRWLYKELLLWDAETYLLAIYAFLCGTVFIPLQGW